MIKGLKTEHFSIQECEYDSGLVLLEENGTQNSFEFPKDELVELKELIETCSKYL